MNDNATDTMIPLARAAQLTGLKASTIRQQIYHGTPTPFPIYKHPGGGLLVCKEREVLEYRDLLLTECRVGSPKLARE